MRDDRCRHRRRRRWLRRTNSAQHLQQHAAPL